MNQILVSVDNIKKLFQAHEDLPDYQFSGATHSGKNTDMLVALDGVHQSALPLYTRISRQHIHPHYQSDEELGTADFILSTRLKGVYQQIESLSKGENITAPLISDVKDVFISAWHVFNPEDSYGSYAQAVLQKSANILGLNVDLSVEREREDPRAI